MLDAMARAPTSLMPPSSTVSPASLPSTLPPLSAARSNTTEPGFIERTISAVTMRGALRPGICAVVMTMSWPLMCSATIRACSACSSCVSARA